MLAAAEPLKHLGCGPPRCRRGTPSALGADEELFGRSGDRLKPSRGGSDDSPREQPGADEVGRRERVGRARPSVGRLGVRSAADEPLMPGEAPDLLARLVGAPVT
jgi:hypothetical protein